MSTERLKRLEGELRDLEKWLKLGFVPKKDLDKHREEMRIFQEKIIEEKERLRFLKESGELEEFMPPKRPAGRSTFQEPQSMPDMEMGDEGLTDAGFDMETEGYEAETTHGQDTETLEEEEGSVEEDEEEEEDPFSDRNRWRRASLDRPIEEE